MSTSKLLLATLAVLAAGAAAQEGPGLGEPVTDDELRALDFVVLPDGDGLPPGKGNVTAGAALYERWCLACHGQGGTDGPNDRLAGGHGTIGGERPEKTVGSYWPYATTLFDYIRRAMPYQTPGALTADEVYALTAYVLYLNGIVDESAELDAESLPAVEMPNRDNFEWAYAP